METNANILPIWSRLEELGFSFGGLTARLIVEGDFPLVNEWWITHKKGGFAVALLPPLGVMVEDESGPVGALWCYEPAGVGVGFLEFPVTRPGCSAAKAKTVMAYALATIMGLAGKFYDPPGEYNVFRACTTGPIARFLRRLGFHPDGETVNLIYTTFSL